MQRIIDICESRVSLTALRGPYDDDDAASFASFALCVDGTSATRKSTVLARTGLPVRKVQRFAPVRNADTYYPSMIGYIAAGINGQNTGGAAHLNDRSYLNTLEWCVLWRLMDDYVTRKGNTDPLDNEAPDASERAALLDGYRQAFRDLVVSYHYRSLRRRFRALAFLDSNVARCDELRTRRGEGSDRERSAWRFYTPLQNLMYETLYPAAHIDLAWFDELEENDDGGDLLVASLAHWLRRLTERLACLDDRAAIVVPHRPFHLPIADTTRDYSLRNMETHVYRTFGRLAARKLALSRKFDHDLDFCARVANTIPDYVNVARVPKILQPDDGTDDADEGDADDDDVVMVKRLRFMERRTASMSTFVESRPPLSAVVVPTASLSECDDSMFVE